MTNSFDELEQASCLFVIGSNTTVAHPMVGMRLMHCHREGGKLIVADPRRTDLARLADVHLRLRPGTDVPLVNGLMHIIYENGWHDAAFIAERTENFDELRESLREWTPERTEEVTGVPRELLFRAAELYARSETSAIVYCLGITQHRCGVNNVRSLANLSMLCGQIGRPCTGVNPLRGQNNVQGACDMGGLPNYYPGYQFVDDEKARLKFEAAWGRSLSPFRGLTAMEMMHGLQEGKLKAMIIMGENPVVSDPDSGHVVKALSSAEFLLCLDIFPTPTTELAHMVLPGASFAETDGTFTNSERQAIPPMAGRTNGQIIQALSRRLGYDMHYASASEVFDEICSLAPNMGGMSYARLEGKSLCWPCPTPDHPGTPILHMGEFAQGLGSFSTPDYQPSAELPDAEYPLVMMTGRILYQYNACAMTARTDGVNEIADRSFIELNTCDAEALGIADGDIVRVSSRRGSIESVAHVSEKTNPGQTWMPFHFQDGNSNWLTIAALDRVSKAPEYKVCAVKVEKA